MKILVLTHLYPPHHAGTYDFRCETMTEALKLRGHTMQVLTSRHGLNHDQPGGEVERRLMLNGIYDHRKVASYHDLRAMERVHHQIFNETIARFQPDLIHVYSLAGLSKSLIFALRRSRLPTVYDIADDWLAGELRDDPWLKWWNQPRGSIAARCYRLALEWLGSRNRMDEMMPTRMMQGYDRLPQVFGSPQERAEVAPNSIAAFRFDRLYFASRALKERCEQAGFRVSHAEVIYPGFPTQDYVGEIRSASEPVNRYLVVAPLRADSGVQTVLEAFKILKDNDVHVSLSICGKGDSNYVAKVRSYAAANRLQVEFFSISNPVKDLPGVFRRHDAFMHPAEGAGLLSMAPLQAMAAGLPVIGTPLGGVGELLRHGENAIIYQPGNPQALATEMLQLQLQPALRRQIADTAQQEVLSQFNDSAVTDRVEDYLQTSLEVWAHEAA